MNIGKSIQQLYDVLIKSGVTEMLKLKPATVMSIATGMFWTLIAFCILSLLVIIGHRVGFFKEVHSKVSRTIVTLKALGGVLMIAIGCYNIYFDPDGDRESIGKLLGYFRLIPQMSIAELALFIVALLLLWAAVLVFLGIVWWLIKDMIIMIIDNICGNGIFRGIILSIFDIGTGVFWCVVLYGAICGALAFILLPLLLVLFASYDSNRYVVIIRD